MPNWETYWIDGFIDSKWLIFQNVEIHLIIILLLLLLLLLLLDHQVQLELTVHEWSGNIYRGLKNITDITFPKELVYLLQAFTYQYLLS